MGQTVGLLDALGMQERLLPIHDKQHKDRENEEVDYRYAEYQPAPD